MRKESSQVGGLLMLHLTYHQTFCDLNRIALGNLFKIRPRIEFPPSQEGFLRRVQDQCFEHAVVLSSIFDEAAKHGPDTLADTWLCCVAHDSAKVMVNYVSKGMGSAEKDKSFRRQVTSYLHGNLRALKRMIPMYALAKQLASTPPPPGLTLPETNQTRLVFRGDQHAQSRRLRAPFHNREHCAS